MNHGNNKICERLVNKLKDRVVIDNIDSIYDSRVASILAFRELTLHPGHVTFCLVLSQLSLQSTSLSRPVHFLYPVSFTPFFNHGFPYLHPQPGLEKLFAILLFNATSDVSKFDEIVQEK